MTGSEETSGGPSLSVVIASLVGPPFIDDCVESVLAEARTLGAEILIATSRDRAYGDRLRRRFADVQVIHATAGTSVPGLRARGVDAATGHIVAVIEEHCVAERDWLAEARRAHEVGAYAAVGGPIVDRQYERLRDWVVYFCEYNGSLPPWKEGETTELNGANVAYRRDVLMAHRRLLDSGYWEATLHPALLAGGHKFRAVPGMRVAHRGPFDFGYYLRQRYLFSRAFAGARAASLPASRRLAYLAGAPLVPPLLLARMAARVWAKRCHPIRFAMTLPLIVPALGALVAGEWVGYLAGPGDALSKVE